MLSDGRSFENAPSAVSSASFASCSSSGLYCAAGPCDARAYDSRAVTSSDGGSVVPQATTADAARPKARGKEPKVRFFIVIDLTGSASALIWSSACCASTFAVFSFARDERQLRIGLCADERVLGTLVVVVDERLGLRDLFVRELQVKRRLGRALRPHLSRAARCGDGGRELIVRGGEGRRKQPWPRAIRRRPSCSVRSPCSVCSAWARE